MRHLAGLAYADRPECLLDALLPEETGFPVVVYFHGGGLESGSRMAGHYGIMGRHTAAAGIGFISCDYRMYPAARFPDYLVDAAAAVRFVKEHLAGWGGNGTIYVSGQSAGAYITMMLCLDGRYLAAEGMHPSDIAGWVSDSAQQTTHYNVLRERGLDTRLERLDEAAPLYFVDADTNISRMLLIAYEQDIPGRPEQNRLTYATIRKLRPDTDISLVILPGGHCAGSSHTEDGEYPYIRLLLDFVRKTPTGLPADPADVRNDS